MASAQRTKEQFDAMFYGVVAVMNPLAALRMYEDAQLVPYGGGKRAQVLQELEHLSHCLWHLSTLASTTDLRKRLLDLPECGADELRLLNTYRDLFGLPLCEGEQGEAFEPSIFGTDYPRHIA